MIGVSLIHKALMVPRVELFSIWGTFGILPAHSFENLRRGTFPLFTIVPTGAALLELIEIILTRPYKVPLLSPVQAAKDLSLEKEIIFIDKNLLFLSTKSVLGDSQTVVFKFLCGNLSIVECTAGDGESYLARAKDGLEHELTSTSDTGRKALRVEKTTVRIGTSITVICNSTLVLPQRVLII